MMSVVIAASGQRRPHLVEDRQVARRPVGAAHPAQHVVRAGLQRHVQLRADVRRLGHRGDDVGGEVARVRRGEPDPLQPVDVAAGPQQLRERAAVAELDAVGVDVLPEQRHLQHAVGGQRLHLGEHVAGAAVLLGAAQRRARCRTCRCCCSPPRSTPSRRRPTRGAPAAWTGTPPATRRSPPGRPALCRARSSSTGSACTLCVPNTTSTHGARRTISARSFCARQPPTAICMPGRAALTGRRWPRLP